MRTPSPVLGPLLCAVLAAATVSSTAGASAHTAQAPTQRVSVSSVSATTTPTARGTKVSLGFAVRNRTGSRQRAGRAYLFLVAPDGRSRSLGRVATPRLDRRAKTRVNVNRFVNQYTNAGRYFARVCLAPRPGGSCATTRTAVVRIAPASLSAQPGDVALPDTEIGTSSSATRITVTNTGQSRSGALTASLTGTDATDMSIVNSTCTSSLSPGGSCAVDVALAPVAAGLKEAGVRVSARGGASTRVALTGTATDAAAPLSITPQSHDFGPVSVGSVERFTFTVVNASGSDEYISGGDFENRVAYSWDFESSFTCLDLLVPANGSCTVTAAFAPQTAENLDDVLVIFAPQGNLTSALTGLGVGPEPTRSGGSPAPGHPARSFGSVR